jgi:four helix bundle protein
MKRFRFQDFEIWKMGIDVGGELCAIADQLAELHLYAFADQLRRAALSITNNIAEGSGSDSSAEFKNFLNYSRRSVYECANMLLFFHTKGLVSDDSLAIYLPKLESLSKKILNFKKSLN